MPHTQDEKGLGTRLWWRHVPTAKVACMLQSQITCYGNVLLSKLTLCMETLRLGLGIVHNSNGFSIQSVALLLKKE